MSCLNKHPGFREFNSNLFYRIDAFGDSEINEKTEYLSMELNNCRDQTCAEIVRTDTAFWQSYGYSPYRNFWSRFVPGDVITVLLESATDFSLLGIRGIDSAEFPVVWKIRINGVISGGKYSGESEFMNELYRFAEECKIDRWLNAEMPEKYRREGGCYIAVPMVGNGDSVLPDRQVVLSYRAYLQSGLKFDDTDNWSDSLRFIYGEPGQVIPGIQTGIMGLTEGSEVKIIIPSRLAFGESGSTSGIVPPHEPVMYNVKIQSVNLD